MIKYTEIKTERRHCKTCGHETEQAKAGGEYICLSCLMNPSSCLQDENKNIKQGELL